MSEPLKEDEINTMLLEVANDYWNKLTLTEKLMLLLKVGVDVEEAVQEEAKKYEER